MGVNPQSNRKYREEDMNTEDTILKDYKYAQAKFMGDEFARILKQQAEVSFEAGIKEAIEIVGKLENPYAFSDGKCIPKYEVGFNGYQNCREDIIKNLKEVIDED